MTYKVKIIDNLPDWDKINKAEISYAGWGTSYVPETYAQLVYQNGEGFHLKMTCKESNPKAVYTKYMDEVYKDSCMEFFVIVSGERYLNIEMNSNGAMLSAIGADRNKRTPVSEIIGKYSEASAFPIKAEKTADSWSLTVFISNDAISKIFGIDTSMLKAGYAMRGNFYKCGDETESEHYVMWNPVKTENPDYHRPEFFGELILE